MKDEVRAIKEGMNSNSITIFGTDFDRMRETVAEAADLGLHIWLQPRLVDRPQAETLEHLAEGARLAESFRRQGADIHYSIGCVHTVQTPGIVPGDQYHVRMGNLYAGQADHHFFSPTGTHDPDEARARLNVFLKRAAEVARRNFGGELIYSAGPFEDVDWSIVDYVGLTYYYSVHENREGYERELFAYHRWGKPVVISEYGSPAYVGAAERGLMAFDVADRTRQPAVIFDGYVRNEQAQADFHRRMLAMFEDLGIHSVGIAEFIHPTHPHSEDPRYDLDIASWALTRTVRENFSDWASPYRWEPKEAYFAIGEYFAKAAARALQTAA
ncbi:abortive infection protein [Dactylosporangium sp. CA-152071]|uniref:abortive infection protein n=1 Tax=Dactylosporangium sp. CA-152071 TaxID=3239933 RepID=UPI003D8AF84E